MDSYKQLIDKLKIDEKDFAEFGINNILQIDEMEKKKQWKLIKETALDSNGELYIRKYGQQGKNSEWFRTLYESLLNCKIVLDPNNNTYPSRTLNNFTSYRKNNESKKTSFTPIFNYQISHLFGRTKNPLLFTSLWNLAYVPKYFDPFTGHETKGDISKIIRKEFKLRILQENSFFIEEYKKFYEAKIESKFENAIIVVKEKFQLDDNQLASFKKDAEAELKPIYLDSIIDN